MSQSPRRIGLDPVSMVRDRDRSQIDIVNDAFTPLSFVHNGQMVDAPDLARARVILIRAGITTSRINPDTGGS